jgi:hypothetical protein
MGQRKRKYGITALIIGAMAMQSFGFVGSAGANDVALLPTPTGFAAGTISPRSVDLSWNDIVGEEEYLFDIKETREHVGSVRGLINKTTKTVQYSDSAPKNATSKRLVLNGQSDYEISIYAWGKSGKTILMSEHATISFRTPMNKPKEPTVTVQSTHDAITARISTHSEDTLFRNGAGPTQQLSLYVDGVLKEQWVATDGTMYIKTITGLTGATQYKIHVVATNTTGQVSTNNVHGTTTLATPNVTITHDPENKTATLRWDAVPGATAYVVHELGKATSTPVTTTETTVQNIKPHTSYVFTVQAVKYGTYNNCSKRTGSICGAPGVVSLFPNDLIVSLEKENTAETEYATLQLQPTTSGTYSFTLPKNSWIIESFINSKPSVLTSVSFEQNKLRLSFHQGTMWQKFVLRRSDGKRLELTVEKNGQVVANRFTQPFIPKLGGCLC